MKKRNYFIFCIVLILAVILLPEVSQMLDADTPGQVTTLMASGPAFAPLNWKMGQNNMGGYKSRLLFVPADAVSAVPTVPDPDKAADNTELVKAAGSFTFITGSGISKPIYLYSTDGEVEFKAEPQGEPDGISFKQALSFFFPGNTPGMHAFNALVKNTAGYYIFEDVDGRQLIMGQPGLPASTSPSFNGGKARADRRGTTYTATADSKYSSFYLETPIDMEAAGGNTTER